MFEDEEPYREFDRPFAPEEDMLMVWLWRCPPARPSPCKLMDAIVKPPASIGMADRCDLYTEKNWLAMLDDLYGSSLEAYIEAHNAAEVNGPIINELDGK